MLKLKSIFARTAGIVRKIAEVVAAKIRRVARAMLSAAVQVARPVMSAVPAKVVRATQCALMALALVVSAVPVERAIAHVNSAQTCLSVTDVAGGWRIANVCAFDILAGWCVQSGEGCAIDPDSSTRFRSILDPNESEVVPGVHGRDGIIYAVCRRDGGPGVSREDYPATTSRTNFMCAHEHSSECSDNNGGCSRGQNCTDTNPNDIGGVACCPSGSTYSGGLCIAETSTGGANSCLHANDGECDDPSYSVRDTSLCEPGTDENDCRAANPTVPPTTTPPPSAPSGGGGGGGDDGGSDNTWIYIAGGVGVVALLWWALSSGSGAAPDITPIAEVSADGAIYGARIEQVDAARSGAMWWEFREFHGNHLHNYSAEFGGSWADSGLFANAEIEGGDDFTDWKVSGGREWQSGQWALRSGVDAAGLGQFGQGPEVDLHMAVEYAVDNWRTLSNFNVPAGAPSDAEVEVRMEWEF